MGAIIEGKVTGLTKFGAFLELPEGKTGMIHISEISHTYVSDIGEHLKEGQQVKAMIISVENNKINLSLKRMQQAPKPEKNWQANSKKQPAVAAPLSFEDKLKQFMQTSESKISDLNKYQNRKGGSGRSKRGR